VEFTFILTRAFLQEGAIIARLVGHSADEGYLQRVRQLFDQIDIDGGGSLSAEEMAQYLKTCGMRSVTSETLRPLMHEMNVEVMGLEMEKGYNKP
jgi:Ca2+-binding EF-hand superfamily protein